MIAVEAPSCTERGYKLRKSLSLQGEKLGNFNSWLNSPDENVANMLKLSDKLKDWRLNCGVSKI